MDRDNVNGVPFFGAVVAVMWLALIKRVAILQVSQMLAFTGEQGRRVIATLSMSQLLSGRSRRTGVAVFCVRPRTVQAIDTAALLTLASAANARVDVAMAIGDTVIDSTPLLRMFGTGRPIEERRLLAAIQVGNQRTFEQDPQ